MSDDLAGNRGMNLRHTLHTTWQVHESHNEQDPCTEYHR